MQFLYCFLYLLFAAVLCFPLGRLFARLPLNPDAFPFRAYKFEKNGKIYEKLHIRKWQNRVPSVSRRFPSLVPPKEAQGELTEEKLQGLIREACVAELTHILLCFLGIGILFFLPNFIGVIIFLIYEIFGNILFILIQRFNRPRLLRLRKKFNR